MKFAAIFVLFANAFSAGIMFLASVFISRYGGKDLFGFFSVILGLIISAAPIVTFGMETAIVRFLPKYREEGQKQLVSGMQRFVLLFATILSVIGGGVLATVLISFRNYSFEIGFAAGICLPLAVILTVLQAVIRADANVSRAVIGEAVVRPFVFAICLLSLHFVIYGELSLLAIIGAYAISLATATFATFLLVCTGRHIDWSGSFQPRVLEIKPWLQLGMNALLSQLSVAIINQSPVILTGAFLSAFHAGEVGAVSRLAMLVAFSLTAGNSVLSPFLARAMANGDRTELQSLAVRAAVFSVLFAFPLCSGGLVLAPYLLSFFGSDYSSAVPFLRLMLFAYFLQATCGVSGALLNMTGKHRVMTRVLIFWAFATIVGLFVGVTSFGVSAAFVVSAIATAGYPLTLAYLCHRTLGIDPTILSLRFLRLR